MVHGDTALLRADDKSWRLACERESVIRALAELAVLDRSSVEEASHRLGISRAWVFKLVTRYRADPVTSSLLGRQTGYPKGRYRLDSAVEALVNAEIEDFFLTRPKPTFSQLSRQIRMKCAERGLTPPVFRTIQSRVAAMERDRVVAARDGTKAARDRFRPVKSTHLADFPLQLVQMDHTLVDVIIVDEAFRKPLGRPTLTLQIDVATRVVPGFYISLEAPSATSVAMAIRHAVLTKKQWLTDRDIDVAYPIRGIPDALHLDNAKEFHSLALERGCQQYGIDLRYRPMRTPHYGGHIERLIGTTIGETHLLPGTTFSNIAEKGDYDAEGHACMTLREFERWFTLQVGIYHGTIHREIGVPPMTAWAERIDQRPSPLRLPKDPARFLLDFLPYAMRRVRREGIELFHSFYWHGALAPLIAGCDHKLPIKYNPLDLSTVFLERPDGAYLPVPFRDRRRPPITKFEHDLAVKALRARGHAAVDEHSLFAMVKEQRQIVLDAMASTKAARRSAQRLAYAFEATPSPAEMPTHPSSSKRQTRNLEPVIPFKIEELP
ncbi:Mu transposase C-terminal domain-containing protein [Sphingobium fuliginis]|jgi:putative transposase|uniref:Mu transposase C-terminal domain-containing protein n=1 Tax=Sphingobium fuliginis (strain ATCC 27551) TaxID=336203 RepID=UPI000471DCD1|nr:Mu transposase C-terminal domain-containing protein [Sphingobium fuliginis]